MGTLVNGRHTNHWNWDHELALQRKLNGETTSGFLSIGQEDDNMYIQ